MQRTKLRAKTESENETEYRYDSFFFHTAKYSKFWPSFSRGALSRAMRARTPIKNGSCVLLLQTPEDMTGCDSLQRASTVHYCRCIRLKVLLHHATGLCTKLLLCSSSSLAATTAAPLVLYDDAGIIARTFRNSEKNPGSR